MSEILQELGAQEDRIVKLEAEIKRLRAALIELMNSPNEEDAWENARCALERQSSRDPDEGLPTAEDVRGILKP